MSSNHIVTRRFGAALVAALMVSVLALGCASDDEGDATTEAATGATGSTDTGTRTLGEGIENLQEAQAQLCPELSNLSADLDGDLHRRGPRAARTPLPPSRSTAAALAASAPSLTEAGADEAAAAAEDLASSLESLAASGADDIEDAAGEAAEGVEQLTDALQCP